MAGKPVSNSGTVQKEIDNVDKQLNQQEADIKSLDIDRSNTQAKEYPEHKISQKDIEKAPELYLKPKRAVGSREKFNEDYREAYNHAKQYVQYTVQHEEAKGDIIEMWTKPFAGMPAEFWIIPSGRPVWIPRYVADKLENGCCYHRLKTEDKPTTGDGKIQYYGSMVVDDLIYRISARPVSTRKLISMGSRYQ